MKKVITYLLAVIVFSFFSFCENKNQKSEKTGEDISGDLIVFHAGSLSVPFRQMAHDFEKIHPNVDVKAEAAGSVTCARKITDLHRSCDIFASADYRVIDELLIPDYADWNLQIAGNEIAIVYNDKSRYSKEINKNNWHKILLKDDVAYGRSDPNSDPCGYRSVLCAKLAARYYQLPGLAEKLLAKDKRYIRPKASDLIALLEVGAIDYMFEYTSVAVQQGFNYIELPDSINLSNNKLAEWYKNVSVKINGTKPGEKITFYGEPIIYGVTIPKNAENPKAALEFMKFIISRNKGLEILKQNGQVIIYPPVSGQMEKVPEAVREQWNERAR